MNNNWCKCNHFKSLFLWILFAVIPSLHVYCQYSDRSKEFKLLWSVNNTITKHKTEADPSITRCQYFWRNTHHLEIFFRYCWDIFYLIHTHIISISTGIRSSNKLETLVVWYEVIWLIPVAVFQLHLLQGTTRYLTFFTMVRGDTKYRILSLQVAHCYAALSVHE